MSEKKYEEEILEFVRGHKRGLIVLLVIFIFSLVSVTWFRGNNLIGGGDNDLSIDTYRYLKTLDSSWRAEFNTGKFEFGLQHYFPSSIIYFPLTTLGLGPVTIEKIWLFLSFFLPALFMYLFLDKFLGKEIPYLIKLSTSLFYVFNQTNILIPMGISYTKYPVFLALPALAYLIVLVFEAQRLNFKILYSILFVLTLGMLSGSFGNMAEASALIIVLGALTIFEIFTHGNKLKHTILVLGILLFGFLINFWWFYSSLISQYFAREFYLENVSLASFIDSTKIFDSMRLMGFWALNIGFRNIPRYKFGSFYYETLGVLLTYLITTLFFSSIIFLNLKKVIYRYHAKVLLFLFLGFVGIFLAKGVHQPFGQWYAYLFEKYSIFGAFREPYSKFSLISLFSFTVVMTFSLYAIFQLLQKHVKAKLDLYISAGFMLLLIIISYPIFNGQTVPNQTYGPMKQLVVKVPQYWIDLSGYSEENNLDGRILTAPLNSYYRKSYIWPSGFVGRPYDLFLKGTKVAEEIVISEFGDRIVMELYRSILNYNVESYQGSKQGEIENINRFVNLARILNVGYVLQMNDFDWLAYGDKYNAMTPKVMEGFYSGSKDYLEVRKTFGILTSTYLASIPHIAGGKNVIRFAEDPTGADYMQQIVNKNALELYALKDEHELPKIYIPDHIEKITDLEDLTDILKHDRYLTLRPLFFVEDEHFMADYSSEGKVEFEKINDAKYLLRLTPPENNFFYLVFSESFSGGWKLAKGCGWLRCKEIIDMPHFRGNYFANAWLLNQTTEDLESEPLYIIQESEFRLKWGILISSTVLILCLGALAVILTKEYVQKKAK